MRQLHLGAWVLNSITKIVSKQGLLTPERAISFNLNIFVTCIKFEKKQAELSKSDSANEAKAGIF